MSKFPVDSIPLTAHAMCQSSQLYFWVHFMKKQGKTYKMIVDISVLITFMETENGNRGINGK